MDQSQNMHAEVDRAHHPTPRLLVALETESNPNPADLSLVKNGRSDLQMQRYHWE
jgi:hypothetical protein